MHRSFGMRYWIVFSSPSQSEGHSFTASPRFSQASPLQTLPINRSKRSLSLPGEEVSSCSATSRVKLHVTTVYRRRHVPNSTKGSARQSQGTPRPIAAAGIAADPNLGARRALFRVRRCCAQAITRRRNEPAGENGSSFHSRNVGL